MEILIIVADVAIFAVIASMLDSITFRTWSSSLNRHSLALWYMSRKRGGLCVKTRSGGRSCVRRQRNGPPRFGVFPYGHPVCLTHGEVVQFAW